ncbi:hypothetical protein BX600DRAFT_517106 [Xylariales sp. PMI_506]|nr:hypothetical protein BX600DRAFT_517106 [Xylariales sp. PMI_506]
MHYTKPQNWLLLASIVVSLAVCKRQASSPKIQPLAARQFVPTTVPIQPCVESAPELIVYDATLGSAYLNLSSPAFMDYNILALMEFGALFTNNVSRVSALCMSLYTENLEGVWQDAYEDFWDPCNDQSIIDDQNQTFPVSTLIKLDLFQWTLSVNQTWVCQDPVSGDTQEAFAQITGKLPLICCDPPSDCLSNDEQNDTICRGDNFVISGDTVVSW